MTFLKRIVLVGFLLSFLAASVALEAAPGRPRPCGQPKGFAAFLQKIGMTSAKVAPCAMTEPDTVVPGQWCIDPGHHCNDGSGPGKCVSVLDTSSRQWSCACITKR